MSTCLQDHEMKCLKVISWAVSSLVESYYMFDQKEENSKHVFVSYIQNYIYVFVSYVVKKRNRNDSVSER